MAEVAPTQMGIQLNTLSVAELQELEALSVARVSSIETAIVLAEAQAKVQKSRQLKQIETEQKSIDTIRKVILEKQNTPTA